MKWAGRRASDNVEDRRGGGGGRGRTGAKIGGIGAVIVVVIGLVTGTDVSQLLGLVGGGGSSQGSSAPADGPPANDKAKQFIAVILADTEDTWDKLFAERGQRYERPKLVLFNDSVDSACGQQGSAVGPFYCPGDKKAYLDLTFFRDLDQRLGAPGDFAQAYVVAHEIGHHIQNLLGTSTKVHQMRRSLGKVEGNKLSVLQELQADCYAGIWAHHADKHRGMLEPGDVEEGLNAAAAIGDDTLQKRARGKVSPESWTHGSSAQRVKWFKRGMETGKIDACDTFGAP